MRLSAEKLVVQRGGHRALDGVSFTLAEGDSALVHGTAGAGKSTLLKVLAGLTFADSGAVYWDEHDVRALSALERRARQADFGMVFQGDALFDSASVLENVMLPLARRKVPGAEARTRALEALDDVGLGGAAEFKPEVLSGGMRKRVGIARAIVARPGVLLADDPFAGLDPTTAASVGALISRIARGRTLVVAAPEPMPWLTLQRRILLVPSPVRALEVSAS